MKMQIRFNGREFNIEAETQEAFANNLFNLFMPALGASAHGKFDVALVPVFRETEWVPAIAMCGDAEVPFFYKADVDQ